MAMQAVIDDVFMIKIREMLYYGHVEQLKDALKSTSLDINNPERLLGCEEINWCQGCNCYDMDDGYFTYCWSLDGHEYDHIKWTPLQYTSAVGGNVKNTLALLLANGADWRIVDVTGKNSLEIAKSMGNADAVECLELWTFRKHFPCLAKNRKEFVDVVFKF